MPKNIYGAHVLIGGGTGALDAIDGAGLVDLDMAKVTTLIATYNYSLDADSAAAESSPDVIAPDTNAGNKRWILTGINEVTAAELSQLKTMGATTISATQWGALGALVEWTDWTPTLTGGADLSGYNVARYYRIGKLCFFSFRADNKNVTTAGSIEITLPFTAANTLYNPVLCFLHNGTTWIGTTYSVVNLNTNTFSVFKDAVQGTWVGNETGVYIQATGFFEIA